LQRYYINTTYEAGLKAAVAFIFIFVLCFTSTIDCTAYVYNSEIWPTHLRSQGTTIGMIAFFLSAVAYNSPASLAFEKIGWKYYLVFISVCATTTTAIAFIFPEVRVSGQRPYLQATDPSKTAGLSLEEIGAEFGDNIEMRLADIHPTEGHDHLKDQLRSSLITLDKAELQPVITPMRLRQEIIKPMG
jgi:hypothetical protein